MSRLVPLALIAVLLSCSGSPPGSTSDEPSTRSVLWAIAIHGGAGNIPRDLSADRKAAYLGGLETALRQGAELLESGASSLDAVEAVVSTLEDDPSFNAGRGAVFTRDGKNELDASIMRGDTLECGAVAGVSGVRNPVRLARLVMERTPHVLLAGPGANAFASEMGIERVPDDYFFTPRRWQALQDTLERRRLPAVERVHTGPVGTVGAVALDVRGNLAAATSTGGMTAKMPGRVGDSPIPGAGTYADDRSCAVSGTGKGEQFIRHAVAHAIATSVRVEGLAVRRAAERIVHEVLEPGDGGVIAVGVRGEIALIFNTPGMARGSADSAGRFEVALWE